MRMHGRLTISIDLAALQRDSLHKVQDYASLTEPVPSGAEGFAQNAACLLHLTSTCPQNQMHLRTGAHCVGKQAVLR